MNEKRRKDHNDRVSFITENRKISKGSCFCQLWNHFSISTAIISDTNTPEEHLLSEVLKQFILDGPQLLCVHLVGLYLTLRQSARTVVFVICDLILEPLHLFLQFLDHTLVMRHMGGDVQHSGTGLLRGKGLVGRAEDKVNVQHWVIWPISFLQS